MVSVIRYEGRPGKSKFDALAPLFRGRSDPEGGRLLPSWQSGGAVLTGVSKVVNSSVVPLCFTCHFPNSVGGRRALLLFVGLSGESCLWL